MAIAQSYQILQCSLGTGFRAKTMVELLMYLRLREAQRSWAIAPDWVIEILSPDQSQTKVTKNILHCLKHHTQIGWLIDPQERSVFVYRSDQPTDVFDKPEIRLPVPELLSG